MINILNSILLVFCIFGKAIGQNKCNPVSYPGQVLLNSVGGIGVDNAQIVINGILGPQTSNGGNYRFKLNSCPGSLVRVQVIKRNYAIVNHVEMSGHIIRRNVSNEDLQFLTIVCLEKDLQLYRLQYYLNIANLDYYQEINNLNKKIDILSKKLAQSEGKNEKLVADLNKLKIKYDEMNNNFSAQQQQRNNLAKIFSSISIDDIDSTYQKAFSLYKEGKLQKAQEVLSVKSIENDSILYTNQARNLEELRKAIIKNKNIMTNKILLKANIFESQLDYDNAYIWYEKAARIDTTNFDASSQFAEFLKNETRYTDAEKWYNISLRNAKSKIDSSMMYNGIGEVYSKNQLLDVSLNSFQKALFIYSTQASEDLEKYISFFAALNNNIATAYILQGFTDKAQPFLSKALNTYDSLVQKNSSNFSHVYSIVLNNYGLLFLRKNDLKSAEIYLTKCVKVRERLVKVNGKIYEPALANALCNLATVYSDIKNYVKSEILYKEAFVISSKLIKENYTRYVSLHAMVLNNMGSLYMSMKKFEKSESYYINSIDLYHNVKQRYSEDYAILEARHLLNMANLFMEQKDFLKAEPYLNRAFDFCKKNDSGTLEFKQTLLNVLNGLGILYKDTDRNQLSESSFKEALRFFDKNIEVIDPTFSIMILRNMGNLYLKTNEKAKAYDAYKKIIITGDSLMIKSPIKYEESLMEASSNLGVMYSKNGEYNKATACFDYAMNIYNSSKNKELLSSQFVILCRNISSLEHNSPDVSVSYLMKAKDVILSKSSKSKEDSISLAYIYGDLGRINASLLRGRDALSAYNNSITIFNRFAVEKDTTFNLILSTQLHNLAVLFFSEKSNMDTINVLLERALTLRINLYNKSKDIYAPDVAEVKNTLGVYYSYLNQFTKAEKLLKESVDMYESLYILDKSKYRFSLIRSLNNLAILYEKFNRLDISKEVHKRVAEIDF